RGEFIERRRRPAQRRHRDHLRLADVGPRHDESLEAPPGGRAPHVRPALGLRFSRRLLAVLAALLVLWAVAGVVVAGYVVARYDRAVTASLASVHDLVAVALQDVPREAWPPAPGPALPGGPAHRDRGPPLPRAAPT